MDNSPFNHLILSMTRNGKPKLRGGGKPSQTTIMNRNNRKVHGGFIKGRTAELSRFWKERRQERYQADLPVIEIGIPILLEIDPASDVDFLRGLGFEIICELANGFIIVASEDIDLSVLNKKADAFINQLNKKCDSPARVYGLCDDSDRLKQILSTELYHKWSILDDNHLYYVDVSVACCGSIELPDSPTKNDKETDEHFLEREKKWKDKFNSAYIQWDDFKALREQQLENIIRDYDGEILKYIDGTPSITALPDSFSARLKLSGKCLRDLINNFPYIFEVFESENIVVTSNQEHYEQIESDLSIFPPSSDCPIVCVIDSGIQEEHRYIAQSIIQEDSQCLVPNDSNVNDQVPSGGHGTRVAGAILYPKTIPTQGYYNLSCNIRNVRVLNNNNQMPLETYPPKIISTIVSQFSKNGNRKTKIYNHSIGSNKPCDIKHMSPWATAIDHVSYENDVLFIQSSGNIPSGVISSFIKSGEHYPDYLARELSRISNPGQSLQALTVGSVSVSDFDTDDSVSLGRRNQVSSFSRCGPGIWDVIKPDVAEYGGTHVKNKNGDEIRLTTPPEVCPELIRKSPEGPAFSRDAIGTSFAAPKVSYIASMIEKAFPDSPALLYRALIAQSARWPGYPDSINQSEYQNLLRRIGYGIPDVDRATHNNEYRVTLITPDSLEVGEGEAHIFEVPIPDEIRSVGEDFDILVEITLSYAAQPRRTRRYTRGYLSSWVDWCASKIGEDPDVFSRRIFETGSKISDDGDFRWMLGEAINRDSIDDFSRKNGTLQKDWCIISSNQLSRSFCIAVRGHKGWGSLFKAKYSLAVSLEAINQDIPIYEPIRVMLELETQNKEIEVEMELST